MTQDQSTPATPSALELAGTVPVEDLDTFVRTLTAWHTAKMRQVNHLLEVPPGATFEVGDQTIVLTGTALEAFKLGVELCKMQLGTLPFAAEYEDAPDASASAPADADAKG